MELQNSAQQKRLLQLSFIIILSLAVFCDGEFFHGKDWEVLKPRLEKGNNSEYWLAKISRNRERDDEINKKLLFMGWTVIRFWGKDIKKNTDECVRVVEETIFDRFIGI